MFGLVSLIDHAKPFIKRPPQSYNKHWQFEFNEIFERKRLRIHITLRTKLEGLQLLMHVVHIVHISMFIIIGYFKPFNINYYFMNF